MSDQFQTEALWKTLLDLAESDSRDSNVIPHLRIILEGIYKAATSSLPTSFSNLFSRMQYLHKQEGFPFELAAQASLMRILCNCVLHDGQVASPAEVLSCYLVLTRLLTHFFPQKAAPGLLAWLEKHKAVPFAEQSRTDLSSFSCVVNNWSLSNADQPPALNIIAFDEYGQECSILLCPGSSEGKNWLLLNKTLWQNAYLTFHKLKPVQNRKGFYQSTPETLVVLEPDFLVDASALAECFAKEGSFPEHFVLSKLISEASTAKTATGKVVNSLFDELVLNPQADYDTLFRSALEHQPISLLALGIQTTLKIHDEIKTNHFPQLQKIAALYKDSGLQLEPSFIAPGYGLQGRLDLLANQHGKYQIIELKSGKSPSYDVWKTQQMQVVAYNLIIKASLGQKNLSSSSIFYSEHAKNPLRNVVNSSLLEQELLMCRNRIVGILHRLTDDPSFFFDWIKTRQENYPNPILQNRFETCQGILAQLSELEYQWFLTQVRWLMKEIWQAKVGGTGTENGIYGYNRLWRKANSIKLNDYELMKDLLLTRVECNTISLAIQPSPDQSIPSENSISNFRQADLVVLYHAGRPIHKQEILRGVIQKLSDTEITIRIRGGLKNSGHLLSPGTWSMEHDLLESALYSPLSSIFSFLAGTKQQRQLIMGCQTPGLVSPNEEATLLEEILLRMEQTEDYLVVQGPPGTGKTSGLLSQYICHQYHESSKNILILSFTNRAVDEICLNLDKQQLPYLRTGSSTQIEHKLLATKIQGKRYQQMDNIIRNNRIWVSTVHSCNSWFKDLIRLIRFDELIIDEASQIIEPMVLGIISHVPKLILIGDQNQLPPIVMQPGSSASGQDARLLELCYHSFGQSILERLWNRCTKSGWHSKLAMLQTQYRMHRQIRELVSENYQNRLSEALDSQIAPLNKQLPPDIFSSPFFSKTQQIQLLSHRTIWIETPPSDQLRYDPLQASLICELLRLFTQSGVIRDAGQQIGIIAPFRAMIQAVFKALPPEYRNITIDTVERFQGSERQIMIITLPLQTAYDLRMMEALNWDFSIDRKLNVELSRARDRLFILGNTRLCSASLHYRKVIDKIRAQGLLTTIDNK